MISMSRGAFGSLRVLEKSSARTHTALQDQTGRKVEIRYTVGDSDLGKVVLAATEKGLCSVSLRESDADAEESLRARFPRADIRRDDAALSDRLAVVIDRISGRRLDVAVPLDLQGTEFQKEVWDQLLTIPPGKTRSYLDVARAINRPKATRAVAQACGANPVAVVVPCHRVVMADGSIGGYSGLPGVKKALLGTEGAWSEPESALESR